MTAECGVEANFACTKCGKKYKRKAVLKAHLINKHKIGRSQLAAHGIGNADIGFSRYACKWLSIKNGL